MNKALLERNIAAVLFVLVLVVFSFAERDTKKITLLYQKTTVVTGTLQQRDELQPHPMAEVPSGLLK